MYERILVPLDRSEGAEAAVPFAALIPSQEVRLLHVEPLAATALRDRAAVTRYDLSRLQRALTAHDHLGQVGEVFRRQGREVDIVIESGDPGDRIVRGAADADLVVMATRGHGAGWRLLFGSVADHVVRHAPAPTLLVRDVAPHGAPSLARIVVPLDGGPLSEHALPAAAMASSTLGLRPHLVHVVDPSLRFDTVGTAQRDGEAYLTRQLRWLAGRAVVGTSEVRSGIAARELLAVIRSTDIVVMTTRGLGGVRRLLLGSIAEQLVRHAPGPVLLVRAGDRQLPVAMTEADRAVGGRSLVGS